MDRRILLTLLGTAVTAPAHEWLLARPEAAVAHSAGSPLPMAVVDYLDDIVGQLRRMDDQVGSGTLLPLVRAHLQHVVELLDQRRYTDTVGRRLHATAAELMRLTGWLALTAGAIRRPSGTGSPRCTPRTPPGTRHSAPTSSVSCPNKPTTSGRSGSRSR
ncbi:MAG: hypothetical protein M3460_07380 [Actinomycetota bacterium]|nr:hypothetical protein [Actinomycetota bacterium]